VIELVGVVLVCVLGRIYAFLQCVLASRSLNELRRSWGTPLSVGCGDGGDGESMSSWRVSVSAVDVSELSSCMWSEG
jgi:hypothetical protein